MDNRKERGGAGRLLGWLRRVLRCTHGGAMIEVALMMPVFTIILVGAAEFSRVCYAGIEVANAARAGVEYGVQSTITAQDTAGIQAAATNDAPNLRAIQAVATTFCTCSNGTTITCANTTACTARVSTHVQVKTSVSVPSSIHLPGLPASYSLNSTAEMRLLQ